MKIETQNVIAIAIVCAFVLGFAACRYYSKPKIVEVEKVVEKVVEIEVHIPCDRQHKWPKGVVR